jgi:ATP-binding cassette subfamily B protein
VLRDPRILILDEATTSLDGETERQIQEALARLITGRTTIAIAHRRSTLRNADRLVVLDHGKIGEMGTHEQLIRSQGTYHRLVQAQRDLSRIRGVEG